MTPLHAYAARSCPTRTHFDVVQPVTPEPPGPLQRMLIDDGVVHERAVFDVLTRAYPSAVVIHPSVDADTREQLTRQAMRDAAPMILGGRLADELRVGEPDVLVYLTSGNASGYAPIDVKTDDVITTTPSGGRIIEQPVTDLAWPDGDTRPYGRQSGATRRTLIQLAHYQALLETSGFAVDGEPWVGIIGSDVTAIWFCLDDPIGRHDDTSGLIHNPISVTEIYQLEFAYRQKIAEDAAVDPHATTRSRLAPPVSNPECPHCPWRAHCGRLWEERDDVSLLPRVDRHVWSALQQVGLDTIPALAAHDAAKPVRGFTATAFEALSDQARAASGPHPVYRRRGVTSVQLHRADLEVDVDMENVEDGAYLWGLYVTDRTDSGMYDAGYLPFYDWNPNPAVASRRAFMAMWEYLTGLRASARVNGMTFAAYCWAQQAENHWLKRGAWASGMVDEVDEFISSYEWVDLYDVVRRQLITGRSNGLKTFAPLTGFSWRDADAGGDQAIVWWQHATDDGLTTDERQAWQTRLLTYNEDDVRATLHVRDWLDARRTTLPSIVDWTALEQR